MDIEEKDVHEKLKTIDILSDFLDSRFRIPGTEIRFGLDFIVGLVPYAGDLTTFVASGAMIVAMVRHGAGGMLVVKMLWNILLDTVMGSVPILGDIFDLRYRANRKNFELLKEHYKEGAHSGSAWPVILAVIISLIALFSLMIWVVWEVASWSWESLMNLF